MTTIFVDEDIQLKTNKFSTFDDLFRSRLTLRGIEHVDLQEHSFEDLSASQKEKYIRAKNQDRDSFIEI